MLFVKEIGGLEKKYNKSLDNFEKKEKLIGLLISDTDIINIPIDLIKSLSDYLGNDEQKIINLANKYC